MEVQTATLSTQTRPDLATIANVLAQHNHKASSGHIDVAKCAIRCLKGTRHKDISFSSKSNHTLESFIQFPLDPDNITNFSDANWGPQDASKPKPNENIKLDLFGSRSIAGYLIWLCGPLHWSSKGQSFTARSSAEAKMGSIDDCAKALQQIRNILQDLKLFSLFSSGLSQSTMTTMPQ